MCWSATTAAAFTVQEEAVETEGDADEDEDAVEQAADEEEAEEAETEETGECHCKTVRSTEPI